MKTIKRFCQFLIFIFLLSCTDDDNSFIQFFIENTTHQTIYVKTFRGNLLQAEFKLKPNKRKFLDGYMRNGDVQTPFGISTIRADSIVIELSNKKKWIDVCKTSSGQFAPSNCKLDRSLFNARDYKLVTDNGRFSYYNRIFEFDENDTKNAK